MFFTQWIANIISYLTVCILLQCSHILIREQEWTVRIEKMYPLERSLSCLFMPELYLSWWETIGVTAGSAIFTGMVDVYFLFWKLSTFTCRIYASGRPSETRRNVVKQSELI